MRLPHLSKTQKKVAIGAGAGVGLLALTWLVTRSKKKTNGAAGGDTAKVLTAATTSMALSIPVTNPNNQFVTEGTRVIAWPTSSIQQGMTYIKFTENGRVRGGWMSDSNVLRDSEKSVATTFAPQGRALSGLGAGGLVQQQVPQAPEATPNAVVIHDGMMFLAPGDKPKLDALQKRLGQLVDIIGKGSCVFVPDEETFRKIYTYQGARVLNLVPGIFYRDGKFTKDELANHAHCQTYNAQVINFNNDWLWPFYNQNVYRYPSNNPNYAGVPIDPHTDPAAWDAALKAAIEANVKKAIHDASISAVLSDIEKLIGNPLLTMLFGKLGALGLLIEVPVETRNNLAKFGVDIIADYKKDHPEAKGLPTTVDGKLIPEDLMLMLRASAGALATSNFITMFESHNTDKNKGVVNPCIRPLDFDLVLSILIAVVSAFLTVVSLGSAGLLGPVLSAVQFAYSAPKAIKDLGDLSK